MKKITLYGTLLILAMINTAAMCDNDEEPTPVKMVSLIGKWKLRGYTFKKAKTDGSVQTSEWLAEAHNVNIIWEFYDDGVFKSYDGKDNLDARWELRNVKLDGDEIISSNLRIFGNPALKDFTPLTGTEDLQFDMDCGRLASGKLQMGCLVDATQADPNKLKTTIYYYYVKL